ncbi:MAG: AMP-binding protein [Oscillospiraceae bacterium]|jgi:fatty-acyl-CoA synthase|nr:AMP-binding protein [Oscillospiraceae bacterium]
MKLAVSTLGCTDQTWQEIVTLSKDIGLDGIELRGYQQIPVSEVLQAIDRLRTGSLEIACISCNSRLHDVARLDEALEEARGNIRLAGQLGARFVRVLSGCAEGGEETDAQILEAVRGLLPLAEECGVTLLLESNGIYADTKRLSDLLNALESDHVGALWDLHHPYRYYGERPEQTVQNLGPYIKHIHCKDSVLLDGKAVFRMMGEGDLPLKDCFRALRSIKYDGYVTYEWMRQSAPGLVDSGVVFPHFVRFMQPYLHRSRAAAVPRLYDNESKTGQYLWPKLRQLDLTLPEALETVARTFPDQPALRTDDAAWTYGEALAEVDRVARALIALGVRPGAHVAVWATNVPEYFFAFWACAAVGATLVTMNTAYKLHEAEYLLRQADIHTLILIEGFKDSHYAQILQALCPELETPEPGTSLHAKALPFLHNVITIGFSMPGGVRWEDFRARSGEVAPESLRARKAMVRRDDVVNIQYTSGTTGFPKGVMITHANVLNGGKFIGDALDFSTADRIIMILPMFHCFSIVASMLAAVTHGTAMRLIPAFSPAKALKIINDEKITVCHGVPTMFHAMLAHPDSTATDFSSLRTGGVGGASCPPKLLREIQSRMGLPELAVGFGMTESSSICTITDRFGPFEAMANTVGPPLPGVECKIIHPETEEELPDGADGELLMRGFNVMQGYYKFPEATAATLTEDGWLHTGDMARRDADGNLKITGRIKDMIIRGGENIYPKELEDFFFGHPQIFDVQVVGVPDPGYGEEVFAWVIRKPGEELTEEEIRAYALDRIAKHKVPRYIRFTDSFPINASGKVLKYKLRAMAVEALHIAL